MKSLKKLISCFGFVVIATCFCASSVVFAHSRWVVPSHTILSADRAEEISLDFSISNDIFHPDMSYGGGGIEAASSSNSKKPATTNSSGSQKAAASVRKSYMQQLIDSTRLQVTYPSAKQDASLPFVNLGRKSSAVFALREEGTYRFRVTQNPVLITTYKNADGSPGREFGGLEQARALLPENVQGVRVIKIQSRVETFVTRKDISAKSLVLENDGLELVFSGHPNELFSGEQASLRLMLNGKPVQQGVKVRLTQGGTRYRNLRKTQEWLTDKDGGVGVTWPAAGMYLLEADLEVPSSQQGIDLEVFALYLTLEINPE